MSELKLIIDKPYRVLIPDCIDSDRLRSFLSFVDKTVQYDIQRLKKNQWLITKYGEEYYMQQLNELKAKQKRCLLQQDADGRVYTYSGLAQEIASFFHVEIENRLVYPTPRTIPWFRLPEYELRPYQSDVVEKMLEAKHAAVSVGTGLGKTACIMHLTKQLGLPTLVVVPSISIGSQIYELFKNAFGAKYVGIFGGGKKQFKKRFVIALAQSLTRLEPEDPAYSHLKSYDVVITDESHLLPAITFEKVMMGVCANASYRFSFSATQMRNDGAELLLKGLIGPIVYEMSVRQGVDQGYLAKPIFHMVKVDSNLNYSVEDPNAMERKHLLNNPRVIETAAAIANQATKKGLSTLILIDEFEQAARLDNYLTCSCEFAHGGARPLTAAEKARERRRPGSVISIKDLLPTKWHKSDVHDQVRRFNKKQFPVLIGTSAIGLGTDIQAAHVLIVIQKGKSEVKFKQSVGRGTRRVPGKDSCLIYDFDIVNVPIAHRHAKERAAVYESIYGPVRYIDISNPWYKNAD